MNTATTNQKALHAATLRLQSTSPSARVDAQSLLCHVLGCNTAHLAAWPERPLLAEQLHQFEDLLRQREAGRPVAYLTGVREFWSLPLNVNSATLIPRPETETLVEFVLQRFAHRDALHIADLGTGSGAIAIALASERADWSFTATDISTAALQTARDNARKFELAHIRFVHSHWFEQLADERFDIIISNPPYVAENDPHLQRGDLRYEPADALVSGTQGLDAIVRICDQARQHLHADGWLILEHGYQQKQAVADCLHNAGFAHIEHRDDLSGQPRMTAGKFTSY